MSRIGKQPVAVPASVKVEVKDGTVRVEGPKGKLEASFRKEITIRHDAGQKVINVTRNDDERQSRALHGLTRSLINNMVQGVSDGYTKQLEMVGIGYRASLEGEDLVLAVGYSHPVRISAPNGIKFTLAEGKINVSGIDKQLVGQVSANIRKVRKPEPYKGKGIRYVGEIVRRKAGKAAKAGGK